MAQPPWCRSSGTRYVRIEKAEGGVEPGHVRQQSLQLGVGDLDAARQLGALAEQRPERDGVGHASLQ
jgi:hypothetical protein